MGCFCQSLVTVTTLPLKTFPRNTLVLIRSKRSGRCPPFAKHSKRKSFEPVFNLPSVGISQFNHRICPQWLPDSMILKWPGSINGCIFFTLNSKAASSCYLRFSPNFGIFLCIRFCVLSHFRYLSIYRKWLFKFYD